MLVKTAVDFWLRNDPSAISRPMLDPPSAKPWRLMPWDNSPPAMNYTFPPRDLLMRLVALYFSNVNIFFPVLHRPTFEKTLASHAHLSDDGFAKTVLLVCALGARYSDDPRAHLPATPLGTAGWVWYDQVKLIVSGQPTLTCLQNYCLSVQFLDRTSGPRAAWTIVGFGIRLGQDIGAHRLKLRKRTISPEEELEKRAYWTLVLFDAQLSGALGRSIAIQSHDFDLDQPSPVDDEYWEPSLHNPAFSQPPDKPSLIDFFNCQLNLNRILSFTLKVFYSTNRSRSIIGVAEDSWEKLVMEFDSALNTWRDSVPAHLRWNQGRQTDDVFFDQAAALACNYHLTQILIHRPFIPAVKSSTGRPQCDPSLMSQCFPSLTICHNAARACSHVAEIHHRRRPNNPLPFAQTAVFTSGIVLLLSIWGGHRAGGAQNADFSDVHRCLSVLRAYNERWPSAGPLLDTLEQLLKVDHALPRGAVAANPELPSPDNSSGSSHGTPLSLPPLQRDTELGVPSSSAGQRWPAFDPTLEIFGDSDMLNHHYGPGEAPAHAPHVVPGGLRYHDPSAGAGTTPYADTSAYQSSWSFPAAPGDMQHRPHTYDTVAIWSAAPSGFEASDWDSYLNSMGA
ncbi:fungal-specific transcription factor domain-containing protein [Mycena olivaceomarginata]|nr:fungal-specific transcription factor domain-containing protein [Mycena olivaceomarginata]